MKLSFYECIQITTKEKYLVVYLNGDRERGNEHEFMQVKLFYFVIDFLDLSNSINKFNTVFIIEI